MVRKGSILDGVDQMAGAISHTLLPYTRINLYRSVDVYSPLRFKLLRRTVASGGPELASLIDSFTLCISLNPPRNPGQWEYKRRLAETNTFFGALTNVRYLTLDGSTFSAHCLLLESFPSTNLRRLRSLVLKDFAYAFKDPFAPFTYTHLDRFEALTSLSFEFYRGTGRCAELPTPPPPSAPLEKNRTVRELEVEGELKGCEGWSPLKHLLGHFDNLIGLIVSDHQGVNFAELLSEVTPNLKHLSILRIAMNVNEDWHPLIIDPVLDRFPALETLHLGHNTFRSAIFRTIAKCRHLRQLTFARWAPGSSLSFADLSYLLSKFSGTTSPLLIEMNMVRGASGAEGPFASMEELSRMGWEPPVWTDRFSHQDAMTLVSMVENSGGKFSLDKSLYLALEHQVAYDEQVFQVHSMMEREPFEALMAMEERIQAVEAQRAERARREERHRVQQVALEAERVRRIEEYGLDQDEDGVAFWNAFWR